MVDQAIKRTGIRKGVLAQQVGIAPATLSRFIAVTQRLSQKTRERMMAHLRRIEVAQKNGAKP